MMAKVYCVTACSPTLGILTMTSWRRLHDCSGHVSLLPARRPMHDCLTTNAFTRFFSMFNYILYFIILLIFHYYIYYADYYYTGWCVKSGSQICIT